MKIILHVTVNNNTNDDDDDDSNITTKTTTTTGTSQQVSIVLCHTIDTSQNRCWIQLT